MAEEEEVIMSNGVLLLLMLMILTLVLRQCLKSVQFIQTSGLATMIGIISGGILTYSGVPSSIISFTRLDAGTLFVFLVPPIIFESGYNMNKHQFLKQLGTICTFAFLGTLISAFVIGSGIFYLSEQGYIFRLTMRESFVFGSLISATDTISVISMMKDLNANQQTFNIIFGESLLNDAVAIVYYQTMVNQEDFESIPEIALSSTGIFMGIFCGSLLIGSTIAVVTAYILKSMSVENRTNLEACTVIFGPWIAFLIAEALEFSGIVAVLMCAVLMARYTHPNLSEFSRQVVCSASTSLAKAADILCFLYLGLGLFSFELPFQHVDLPTLLLAFSIILISRIVAVFVCTILVNIFRSNKIGLKTAVFIWFSGFRGVIAFALAIHAAQKFDGGEVILGITVFYAILSILGGGCFIACLVKALDISDEYQDNDQSISRVMKKAKKWVQNSEEEWVYRTLVRSEIRYSEQVTE